MKKLTRRDFLKVTGAGVAGAAIFGTTACGGGDGGGQGGGGGDGGGQVTLTWWDPWVSGANDQAMKDLIQGYMQQNPDVRIERRAIPGAEYKNILLRGASAGDLPNIAQIDNPDHQSFANLGILADLTERVEDWGQAGEYFEGPWNSVNWQGKVYGIPYNSNCLVLFYNRDFMEEAGVEPPTNWDEFLAAAEALTEGDRYGFAASAAQSEEGTFQWLPWLWQAGADVPTINSAGGRAALKLWTDMVNNGYMSEGVLGWSQSDALTQLQNGQAAMVEGIGYYVEVLKAESPDLNWGVTLLPRGEEAASCLGGWNFAIMNSSENVDAAWDALVWTQQPEQVRSQMEQIGHLPARRDLANEPPWSTDPQLSVVAEQLQVARARAYGPEYPEISSAIQEAIQAAISGESDVDAALQRAQEKIEPLLPE